MTSVKAKHVVIPKIPYVNKAPEQYYIHSCVWPTLTIFIVVIELYCRVQKEAGEILINDERHYS
jgi:hypothetical protein